MIDKIRWMSFGLAAILILFTGCSDEMSEAIVQAARSQSQPHNVATDTLTDSDPADPIPDEKPVSLVAMPSPDRTNPFELSGEFEDTAAAETSGRKREIRVLGFVELDSPAVMLSLDGRTQIFKAGETFDKITVLEIQPPLARINYDGVTWQASIFDRRLP